MTNRASSDEVVDGCNKPVSARGVGKVSILSTRDIIHWQCESSEHRALHSRHGNGGLTIHEGAWAYCDGADADDAHRWAPTGGVALASLVRWTAPNGVSANGDRPLASAASNGEPKGLKKAAGGRR